ncbi:hypothetical protein Goari_006190, partial [Gossypium aridum]|nr:hypothetical protein [Gossypium aridum]
MDEAHANSICYCGIMAALWTYWSNDNLGRGFFGCQNYGDPRYCRFFAWFDNPMSPHARIVIVGLLRKVKAIERERKKELIIWGI